MSAKAMNPYYPPTYRRDFKYDVDRPTKITTMPNFAGCVLLVPGAATGASRTFDVVMYVDARMREVTVVLQVAGAVLVDVPAGFSINNGTAIAEAVHGPTIPGGVNPAGGDGPPIVHGHP